MKEVAVIVPIYKNTLSYMESISLDRIHKVLGKYDIIYVEPKKLCYRGEESVKIIQFEDSYFDSIESYNRLLLSNSFYECFTDYKYILICQLDVFIFNDKLLEFCDMGYDYYGAPWLNGIPMNAGEGWRIRFVGNGGLSLRNVRKTIDLIDEKQKYASEFRENEDYFFSYYSSRNYRVAPSDVCRRFCIETSVRRCMKKNKGRLPFGTHAWDRYDFEFWKPYIEKYGYDLNGKRERKGDEDSLLAKGFIRLSVATVIRVVTDFFYRNRAVKPLV